MKRESGVRLRDCFAYLLDGLKRYANWVFGIYALYTVCSALLPFVPVLLPRMLVAGLEQGSGAGPMLAWAAGLGAAGMALGGLRSWAQSKFFLGAVTTRMAMSTEFYQRLMRMDFRKTEDPAMLNRAQACASAFWSNNEGFEGVTHILFDNTGVVLSLVGLGAILSSLHPALVALIAVGAAVSFALSQRARAVQDGLQGRVAELDRQWGYLDRTVQDFTYGKDVRLYRMRKWILSKYDTVLQARDGVEKVIQAAHIPRVVVEATFVLLREGAVYAWLCYLILNGRLALADFAMMVAAVATFSNQLNALLGEAARLWVEMRKVGRVCRFLQDEPLPQGGAPAPQQRPLDIRLEHVSFAYPDGKEVLHDLSLHIQPGEKVAVVGLNGAGKTTLVKLLTGLYEPTKGTLSVGGQPTAGMDKEAYFKLFSALFQDVRVLAATIAENVAMLPPENIDRARVEDCLRRAGLWEKVCSLPQGMDTVLLKNVDLQGTELSGGENQRLALARALYRDAPIVVLDEPTAALDPLAEYALYQRFSELVAGKTAVFISHRLSSTRFCDRILLMQEGRVVESGTHEELMQRGGAYAALFEVQAQYYRKEGCA